MKLLTLALSPQQTRLFSFISAGELLLGVSCLLRLSFARKNFRYSGGGCRVENLFAVVAAGCANRCCSILF